MVTVHRQHLAVFSGLLRGELGVMDAQDDNSWGYDIVPLGRDCVS